MIAMLATLIAYLTGFVAESNRWHYYFQANTDKNKPFIIKQPPKTHKV